ncbi:MAG: PASTA domain-containing protein [Clostridiales bacterium]|nr:PASTA domain-containing protein [Clostridiales bacterium]
MVISIAFLFCALMGRLFYIQVIDGRSLQAKAAQQWYRDLPLKAARGIVYDSTGKILAENQDVYSIYVRPNAVKDASQVARVLADKLDLSYEKLYTRITTERVSEITIKKAVDKATGEAIRKLGLAGVYFTVDSKRSYPEGNLLAQVMGFTNIDNVGQNGIEGYYNKYLTGVDGFAYTATDIKGVELENNVTKYVPSIPGCNLTLTINADIQSFAEAAVMDAMIEWQSKSASMIVMDCTSGAIVASAITPSFDLNNIPRDDINMLNALTKNTLIVDVYEPGSTFKTFTGAIAVEHGIGENSSYYCPGYHIVDGQRIKCWKYIGHGSQNLGDGFKNSCNVVFMNLALSLGTERLYDGLEAFGFGQKTNVDFYGESRGIIMNEANVKTVDLARIGFGQAIAVTPLQMVTAFSAVVNGGILYEPYFVESIDSYDGKNVYTHKKTEVRRVISEETSAKIRKYLGLVVSEGSGKKAQVEGFPVGGKTGTAQKYGNGGIAQGKYVSSFIGAAPIDDPKYVVLMIVDEPGGYVYYGSMTATPYAGSVFGKIANYLGISVKEAEATIAMPELTDVSLYDAIAILNQKGLYYELVGEGTKVVSTVPVAGTMLPEGDAVLLRLS